MVRISTREFMNQPENARRQAREAPVEIIEEGRRAFILMSAEHYDWLKTASRRAHHTADAPEFVIEAVERAEMDPDLAHLDDLLK